MAAAAVAPLAFAQVGGSASTALPALADNPSLTLLPATPERTAAVRAQRRAAQPGVQIWTNGRTRPRTPRLGEGRDYSPVILDEADQVVLVRLAFAPARAGALCYLRLQEGWSIERSAGDDDEAAIEGNSAVRVRANGRVAFVLRRTAETRRGEVMLLLDRVATRLRFVVLSAANQARLREAAPSAAADLD